MPELPEVEVIRQGLEAYIRGQSIVQVLWLDPRMVKDPLRPEDVVQKLAGQVGRRVERRGKFLVWRFVSGAGLLLHLGMSGRLAIACAPDTPWLAHTHLVATMEDGREVRLTDPRRFGRVSWMEAGSPLPVILGPEPFSRQFTAEDFMRRLAGRRAPIKALMLDQRIVAGVGNIYADEALFSARIHPETPGGWLGVVEVRRLHRALRAVLRSAIRHRGTTFRDFADVTGLSGEHGEHLSVYGRAQSSCPHCHYPIATLVVGGRTSHYCARCQPRPDRQQHPTAREMED